MRSRDIQFEFVISDPVSNPKPGKSLQIRSRCVQGKNKHRKKTPLDRCVDLECLESSSFEWLFTDTAFLHSVLCASYAINDFMSPQWNGHPGRKTVFHLRETLSLLRARMQDEHAYQDEAVLRIIINLTLLAAVFGDWVAAAAHFEGLHRIVHLRGNTAFLKARPTLHFKLDRIDLAWSLSSGRRPYFIQPISSWDCRVKVPYKPLPSGLYQPSPDWDFRLANVFKDFQNITLKINCNKLKFVINNPAIFQDDLASLQSRLMSLADLVTTPIEQLVRLTMLAMLTTTFHIPGRKVPYTWVVEQLRDNYIAAGSEVRRDKSLLLWVLMTVLITVAGPNETWIQDAWTHIDTTLTWTDVKERLLRVMWIELVHDKPGEVVYQQLETSTYR
ncbi:hypothetical protein BKA63DRAFT_503502 [Paraphoma chrysanthemicola]|nr:hypothetical protein BKA63DRAFT_503502 [Paraphoma chrysanthemicola]